MNERFLFRAKRLDNGDWVQGYYVLYGYTGKEKPHIIPSYASALYAFEVDPATVGRYTELHDKHGTRIFEGDIIIDEYKNMCIVEWANKELVPGWYAKWKDGTLANHVRWHEKEIIGSIHDNPDLLKGGDGE